MPGLLDSLVECLYIGECTATGFDEYTQRHARARSVFAGYSLEQVIFEYKILRQILIETLETHGVLTPRARDLILDNMNTGVALAAAEFSEMQKQIVLSDREKLEAVLDQLQTITDVQPTLISYVDQQLVYRFVNKAYMDWFGTAHGHVIGKTVLEVVGEKAYRDILPHLERAFDGELVNFDIRLEYQSAGWRNLHVTYIPDRALGGEVRGVFVSILDLTKQKETEQRLRESEERLSLALRSGKIGIWEIDIRSSEVLLSEQAAINLGFPVSKRTGSLDEFRSHVHPDDREQNSALIKIALSTREPFQNELRILHVNGEIRWILSTGLIHFGADDQPERVIGTNIDITEKKKTENLLLDSERQLREFMDAVPVQLWSATPEGNVDFLNRFWFEYTGLNPETTLAQGEWRNTFHPDERDTVLANWINCVRSGQPVAQELRMRRSDGKFEWHVVHGSPVRDRDGKIIRWAGATYNVNSLKKTERALKKSDAHFRLLADAMPQIVWTANPEGDMDYFNQRFYDYGGMTFEEAKGWGWLQIFHPDDHAQTRRVWNTCLSTGEPYHMEYRIRRSSDGIYRWHLGRAVPVRDESGQIIKWFGTNTDIHDYKILTEELSRARQRAEIASDLKSSFLANMSHEIRTPMTAVLGFTEVLKDSQLSEDDRKDAISRIENSGRALLRLIDDVLDISKIEAGKLTIQKTRFSPTEIATEVISVLQLSSVHRGIDLKLEVDPTTPATACSDPSRIRQILMNLVGNAVKFTPKGKVALRLAADGHRDLLFEVSDTGIGISEEDHSKLFQPFMQADASITRKFGGTGLGLVLSRKLAEQLGGTLELKSSRPGKGSVFVARISAAPFEFNQTKSHKGSQINRPAIQSPRQATLDGFRILLAEDVPDNQVLMSRYLKSAGAIVEIANNGAEAIDLARDHEFDLVLMDLQMPKVDGIQATRELRASGFEKPILALTAHAMREETERSLEAGCNAHLTKPITKAALIDAVKSRISRPLH